MTIQLQTVHIAEVAGLAPQKRCVQKHENVVDGEHVIAKGSVSQQAAAVASLDQFKFTPSSQRSGDSKASPRSSNSPTADEHAAHDGSSLGTPTAPAQVETILPMLCDGAGDSKVGSTGTRKRKGRQQLQGCR